MLASDNPSYVCGLDLGQTADFTALCILERSPGSEPRYLIRHAHRYALGTPYTSTDPRRPGVLEQLRGTLALPPLPGATLAVDQTGVGRAVVDLLRGASLPCGLLLPVTITSGAAVTVDPAGAAVRVPKVDLVSCLDVLLNLRRLAVAPDLPLAPIVERELRAFTVKITAAGNETYASWRERDHDDLVLAVALACWAGERYPAWGKGAIGTSKRSPVATAPPGVFRASGKPSAGFGDPG